MPRIDPPMIRPQAKGEMIIGGPDGFPIRLPAGSEGSILTVHDGSPAWETPDPIYTQSQINALLGPLYHDGEEGQVIRFTGGSAEWSDEIDAYTKGEADALLDERSLAGHTHEIEEIPNLALELADRSLLGHTHTAVEVHGMEDYIAGALQDIGIEEIGAAPAVHTHPVTDLETTGTADTTTFLRGDGSWSVVPDSVESVNGKTGIVVLTPSDIGAVESVNGKTGIVSLVPDDIGAAEELHTHAMGDVTGLGTALNSKSDITHTHTASEVGAAEAVHTHAIADIDSTGTPSNSTYLRGDGSWATPPNTNTTYSEITEAEITTGTASTLRTISGRRAQSIVNKARDGVALAANLATVATSGSYTDLSNRPSIPEQLNAIAGTNMTITGTYPNLTFNAAGGGGGGGGAVDSVNGKTGIVVLTPSDIGAVESVNGKTGIVSLVPDDIGAAEELHTHSYEDINLPNGWLIQDFNGMGTEIASATGYTSLNLVEGSSFNIITMTATDGSDYNQFAIDTHGASFNRPVSVYSDPTDGNHLTRKSYVDTGLAGKADLEHTHPISALETTGTPDSSTFLSGDGSWKAVGVGGGAVDSVNGQTGVVVLDATDVGAAAEDHQHGGAANQSTALGEGASASAYHAVALGASASASSFYSTALGANASAGDAGTAVGQESNADGYAVAVGRLASAGTLATAVGRFASADTYAIALGRQAEADAPNTLVASAHTLVLEPRTEDNFGSPSQAPGSIRMYSAANELRSIGINADDQITVDGNPVGGAPNNFPRTPSGKWLMGMFSGMVTNQPPSSGFVPIQVFRDQSWDAVGLNINTAASGATVHIALYADDGTGYPGELMEDFGTVDASTTGTKTINFVEPIALPAGLYWTWAYVSDSSIRLPVTSHTDARSPGTLWHAGPAGANTTVYQGGYKTTATTPPAVAPSGMGTDRYMPIVSMRAE